MSTAAKVALSAVVLTVGGILGLSLRGQNLADGVPWLPQCALYALTGLYCPGCGNTRATQALLNGNLVNAWEQNAFFVVALPFLLWGAVRLWIGWVFPRKLKPLNLNWKYGYSVAIITLVVLFGILRNIPVRPFSWLAPVPLRTLPAIDPRGPVPETPPPSVH